MTEPKAMSSVKDRSEIAKKWKGFRSGQRETTLEGFSKGYASSPGKHHIGRINIILIQSEFEDWPRSAQAVKPAKALFRKSLGGSWKYMTAAPPK